MTLMTVLTWLGMVALILFGLTLVAFAGIFIWIMVEAVRQAITKQKETKL